MSNNKKPNLSNVVRNNIAQFLVKRYTNNVLDSGAINEAAAQFSCCRRTISTIWKRAKEQLQQGVPINLCNHKKGCVRPNRRIKFDAAAIKNVPLRKRGTLRRLANELQVSKSTIHNWVKQKKIRPHTNAVKPYLTEKNRLCRLQFCLNAIHLDRQLNVLKFKCMQNIIHIDEKWFNMTKTEDRFYLCEDEVEPYKSCKSKRFITKVMFLCAVTRPLYASDGQLIFDGKIGIYPFIQKLPAKRKSKNRAAGTLETKPIKSVTKEVIKNCLINQVIPSIHAKWPGCASKVIKIQQDNARPHILKHDPDFMVAAKSNGFDIELVCQPANSPDTNVNDLGWFRALQSLQVETAARTVDELLAAVELSFQNLAHNTLNNVFLSLQDCMIEIIKCKGHNSYRLPHLGKGKLIREQRLPIDLEIDEQIVRSGVHHLVQCGESSSIGSLLSDLGMDNQLVIYQG